MMKMSSLLGGLAGACTLAILNEGLKRIDKNASYPNLLGVNVAAKSLKSATTLPPAVSKILPLALTGDFISNSLYYSMAGGANPKKTLLRGAMLGLGAGVGVIATPQLSKAALAGQANNTVKRKVMTMALYRIGGLVAATTINLLEKQKGHL